MSTQTPPVRLEVTVNTSPERAFEIFTQQMGAWWPASHHVGDGDLADVRIVPETGGRWYEFTEVAPGRTQVQVEHRGLEAYGVRSLEMHGVFSRDGGWRSILASYRGVTEQAARSSAQR